jgi:hypothetical protein
MAGWCDSLGSTDSLILPIRRPPQQVVAVLPSSYNVDVRTPTLPSTGTEQTKGRNYSYAHE